MKKDVLPSLGLLILRLGACGFLMVHGWGKLQMVIAGDFDKFGDPLHLGTGVSLVLATGAEFFCSGLVLVGFFTRCAAIPVAFTMGVAAFVVHAGDAWTMGGGDRSKEPALLFCSMFLALALIGAGRFSIDGFLKARKGPVD